MLKDDLIAEFDDALARGEQPQQWFVTLEAARLLKAEGALDAADDDFYEVYFHGLPVIVGQPAEGKDAVLLCVAE